MKKIYQKVLFALTVAAPVALAVRIQPAHADPIFKLEGLATETDPQKEVASLISILLTVAFSLTVIGIIVGGFLYLIAAGNEERLEKGKTIVTYSIVGLVTILLAYVVVQTINLLFIGD